MHESLTIGQLADRSGVAPSALRYYERLGLIRAERTGGNQRRYARTELRRVAFVRISQQVGIPLEEIREALDSLPAARTPTPDDWTALSQAWRERLDEKIRLLGKLRDDLDSCIGCGCLSLQRCKLNNPDDSLAGEGPGARLVLPRPSA
ncbi:redox-sensitive transcriptional activator SoxR [Micromonospora sp. KC213]|uniref:redox-sensitive transcriptional activator SoxR n=1 Tax=Micromonospora sp. KC213 TaxID=2530378 RepID=UPI001051FDD4|nr:redox-sensitive transcriptional activator SoxR [Micromonospora sp. KC213]TDC38740.1 redox-sensitive transcriptional activator SoxR [Micromonospora sp. KC213]